LHASSGHLGSKYIPLVARLQTQMQNLYALEAIKLQSRQYFAMMLVDQIFEFENEDTR
jgi:hypothetical protein